LKLSIFSKPSLSREVGHGDQRYEERHYVFDQKLDKYGPILESSKFCRFKGKMFT